MQIFLGGRATKSDGISYRDSVDAFGVGGAIANAPVVEFFIDIVERNGEPVSKRGKKGGVKPVYLTGNGQRVLLPVSSEHPSGRGPLIVPVLTNGTRVATDSSSEARARLQYFPGRLPAMNK